MLYEINGTDRTGDVQASTLKITNQIQQRTDNASFRVFQGTKPVENQDIRIFAYALVASATGATIVLKDSYQVDTERFRVGQRLFIRIGDADEEVCHVLSYTESTRTIVLTASPSGSVAEDDKIGILLFGGVISGVEDENVGSLSVIEYNVTAIDYTKIFDKKLVSDTWEDVDARYIINDFVNTTVNYNSTIDTLSYADNTAIQAEYTESGDGSNPTVDTADYMEATASAVFSWVFSGGTATFSGTPTARDVSVLTGASTGQPLEGELMLWVKTTDFADITSLTVRIGSDASNYLALPITLENTTDWQYCKVKLPSGTATGTPDWTALDYCAFVIAETANGTIRVNGLRVNQSGSFTLFNVESSNIFSEFRAPSLKPSAIVNTLAKSFAYSWYVDYERDIHFFVQANEPAPFEITSSGENFDDLSIDVDASQLGNRILVRGGEKTSTARYSQVVQGNNASREWVLKSKFNGLSLSVDDGGTTSSAEVGTTTTNIRITGHPLATGDHIINRTRSNTVRQVTYVDANNVSVEAIPSQTNGDTISFFASVATVGVEGLTDETTVNYVANSNEKSVRATETTATLTTSQFIRFEYNERLPIQVRYTDTASSNALAALGFGDGIFDLDPITDRNITDTNTAIAFAQAKVRDYANPIISGGFITDKGGLKAGQLIRINETNRGLDAYYVIQTISITQRGGNFKDYFVYNVKFGTTLFGWVEFMQKLLAQKGGIEVNPDEVVETFVTANEDIETSESSSVAKGGFKKATNTETAETSDVNNVVTTTPPWQWEASTGQSLATRWNLFEFG